MGRTGLSVDQAAVTETGDDVDTGSASRLPLDASYELYEGDDDGLQRRTVSATPPDPDRLLQRFASMVVARAVDQEAIYLQRQGHLGVYGSSRGQEAAQVGSAAALHDHDWLFPSYREMGAVVVRGLLPEDMLHPWRGTWFATHDVHSHRFGLLTIPLATQTLHAVGFALGLRQEGSDAVVLCYLGDGATSEGDAHEAFNFAAVLNVPVVFVIQNNQYAISVPVSRQSRVTALARRAYGYGMPGLRCDGNDVTAVEAATTDAVNRARSRSGPCLVEAVTYRMEAHTTSDDPSRYRSAEEVARWQALDPLARVEHHLRELGRLDDARLEEISHTANAEASRVRSAIESTVDVGPAELFDHVFAKPSPRLTRQREAVIRAFGE